MADDRGVTTERITAEFGRPETSEETCQMLYYGWMTILTLLRSSNLLCRNVGYILAIYGVQLISNKYEAALREGTLLRCKRGNDVCRNSETQT